MSPGVDPGARCVLGAPSARRGRVGNDCGSALAGTFCGLLNGLAIPSVTSHIHHHLGDDDRRAWRGPHHADGHTILATLPAPFMFWMGNGRLWGVPTPILLVLVVFVAAGVILRMTRYGRTWPSLGTTRCRLCRGDPCEARNLSVYVIHGLLAGWRSGVSGASRRGRADGRLPVRDERDRRGGPRRDALYGGQGASGQPFSAS